MKNPGRIVKNSKKSGILRQIIIPMTCILVFVFFMIVAFASWLVTRMSIKASISSVKAQTVTAAMRIEEYDARVELFRYWYEHRYDLDPVYDEAILDQMESSFKAEHKELPMRKSVTNEEFVN